MAISEQTRAIVWAQSRYILQTARRAQFNTLLTANLYLLWYGIFAAIAVVAGRWLGEAPAADAARLLPAILLGMTAYWQFAPILVGALGISLDTRKLVVYPVRPESLFHIDLALRAMASLEPVVVSIGLAIGALLNARLPRWGALGIIPFMAFNLCLSSATKEVLGRVLARRRWREVGALLFVLIAATPQIIIATRSEHRTTVALKWLSAPFLPWSAAAAYVCGRNVAAAGAIVSAWTALAYVFARSQFRRGLGFDEDAARATVASSSRQRSFAWFFEWPARVFPDPLAALVEKEIRALARSPRFRMVFLMGFSFGVIMLVPSALNHPGGFMQRNFVVFAGAYSLLLLGDAIFYNVFGFDRTAAQAYFAFPVPLRAALHAKNVAAFFFVLLELAILTTVCAGFRFIPDWMVVAEGFAIVPVLACYFIAIGNLTSVHGPRPVDPAKSMRANSPGQVQLVLLLTLPIVALPLVLAFVARWAFNSEIAFFAVTAASAVIGGAGYKVATDSAVATAERDAESILARLSHGSAPIG